MMQMTTQSLMGEGWGEGEETSPNGGLEVKDRNLLPQALSGATLKHSDLERSIPWTNGH